MKTTDPQEKSQFKHFSSISSEMFCKTQQVNSNNSSFCVTILICFLDLFFSCKLIFRLLEK